jgi:hypothetical protein
MPELTEMPTEITSPIAVMQRLVDESSRWALVRIKSGALEGNPIDLMGREVSEFWYLLNSEGEKPIELQVQTTIARAIARESMLVIEDRILGSSVIYVATDELRLRMKGDHRCPLCHIPSTDITKFTDPCRTYRCYNDGCPVVTFPDPRSAYLSLDSLLGH